MELETVKPLSVVIDNSTSTSTSGTVTFTATQTTTHTVTTAATPFLGIPTELWILILPLIAILGWLLLKFNVKTIPVKVLWLAKNYSALRLRASEDLQGLWLTIINARGKKVETIKKTGRAIEVYDLDNKNGIAYTLNERRKAAGLSDEMKTSIEGLGFRVEEIVRKGKRRGYLVKKDGPATELAYLNIPSGGLKHEKLYTAVEGSGHTLDLLDLKEGIDKAETNTEGSDGIIHGEINAAKSWLALLAEAAKANLANTLLMFGGGAGIGGMVVMLALLVSGHVR